MPCHPISDVREWINEIFVDIPCCLFHVLLVFSLWHSFLTYGGCRTARVWGSLLLLVGVAVSFFSGELVPHNLFDCAF